MSKEASNSFSCTSGTINQELAQGIDSKVSSSYIRIRVITSDMSNEINFRLKYEVQMVRMKHAYATKLGLNANELRFVFDGHRITDNDTPKTLGMIDDDVVEMYQEKIGGGM